MANAWERERRRGGRVIITVSHPQPVDFRALCKGEECFHLLGDIQGNQRHKSQDTKVDPSSSVTWDLGSTPPVTAGSWETGSKWLLLRGF